MTLTDRLTGDPTAGADGAFDVFLDWAGERGLSLYPAQEEAVLEVYAGTRHPEHTDGVGEVAGRPGRPLAASARAGAASTPRPSRPW